MTRIPLSQSGADHNPEIQHDVHIWFVVRGEAWAIYKMGGTIVHLWREKTTTLEFASFDTRASAWASYSWASYCADPAAPVPRIAINFPGKG